VESISYFIVFERANGVCGLCDKDVPGFVAYPDPLAGTIDHIIPLSKGGLHVYENIQLAHSICNSRKGNRV
jgi:5-methylcytosine-specific restriction endonuclease McrA